MFGPFEVRLGERVLQLEQRGSGQLLAFLLLRNHPVDSRTIEETFWPGNLRDSYRKAITHLRNELGERGSYLEQIGQCLRFRRADVFIDYQKFHESLISTNVAEMRAALISSEQGLLLGWEEAWVKEARSRLEREREDLLWQLGQALVRDGAISEGVTSFRQYRDYRPNEERAWKALIVALIQDGERLQAIEEIEGYKARLEARGIPLPVELREIRDALWMGRETTADPRYMPLTAGGAVPLDSPYYIEREADTFLSDAIRLLPGIIHLKGPQQTGKSSLLARGMQKARRLGFRVLFTNLGLLTDEDLSSLESLSWRVMGLLRNQLDRDESSREVLSPSPLATPLQRLEEYLHDEILEPSATPVLWALDGLDRLFESPYYEDFFSLLRSWHEARSTQPMMAWGRLTLLLGCATEPHLYIKDA